MAALGFAALAAGRCGYALVGKGSSLPDSIRVVQFTTLENMTQRVQLEQRFSAEIARELASRGRFSVQSGAAGADPEPELTTTMTAITAATTRPPVSLAS